VALDCGTEAAVNKSAWQAINGNFAALVEACGAPSGGGSQPVFLQNLIFRQSYLFMAIKQITVTDAARNFSELVSRIHYQGDSALLVKGGKPMVKIVPANRPKTGGELAALWPQLAHLSPAEATSFERDMLTSRRRLPPLASKWG
jgi:antitoxin (DNA-binding transcriptional repressor) of toxin-antitoxin stability system